MSPSDVESEVEKSPFRPLRLHLVSGKIVDVTRPEMAWMLDRSLMVFQSERSDDDRYDLVSISNIERIEQMA
jgi:hypothetical protein